MSGRRITNPAGSSNALRSDVLRVLGVLKVATADQIQRLTAPHLTYRHLDKPTAAQRKEARTRAHRAAAQDLCRHGLVVDAGNSKTGEKLWSLTKLGLEAAAVELGRPLQEMGATARGAGRTGAAHALCVGETVWALSRPAPDLERLQDAPQAACEAARSAPAGFGSLESWSTEVPLPITGGWASAGRGGAQADAVLAAPEAGVPLLFVEVDTCHMDAQRIATKLGKYMRFLRRRVGDVDGRPRAMWRTRWEFPTDHYQHTQLPPLLLVFHQLGARSPQSSWDLVVDRTSLHWQGRWEPEGPYQAGGFHDYDGKIPLLFTTIDLLRDHGPTGTVFRRAGRDQDQNLADAIGNPRRDAAVAHHRARREQEAQRREREQAAAREARRPACATCGRRFTDERWAYTDSTNGRHDPNRHLCDPCQKKAAALAQAKREAAEHPTCQRCGRPRQDDQHNDDPGRRRAPAPDGLHCAACRQDLKPSPRERLTRFLSGS